VRVDSTEFPPPIPSAGARIPGHHITRVWHVGCVPRGVRRDDMNNVIYLVGLVVVVLAVLAFFGLR